MDFQQVRDETFFMKGKQVGGINAGFVLLNTSKKDLKKMELQLSNALVPGRLPFTHGPEQDYLTRYMQEKNGKLSASSGTSSSIRLLTAPGKITLNVLA